jgi:flagellar biosynthesis GTPase FlhF
MNLLNNIKIFSQQSTSKTMLDNLMKYITPDNIFYQSIFISGSFSNFGSKANTYIDKINSSLRVNIDIKDNKDVIVTNKQYYSIISPQYEFGLAIINSCMYFDFITNKYYIMWKIKRWRNSVIKNYYLMITYFNKNSKPVSQSLMDLMQPLIYNNKISDSYPLTHVNLLEYYYIILKYQADDLKDNDISTINNLVNSEIKKDTTDKEISLLIKEQITASKNILKITEDPNLSFKNDLSSIEESTNEKTDEDEEDQNQDENPDQNQDENPDVNPDINQQVNPDTNQDVNQDANQDANQQVNPDPDPNQNQDQDQDQEEQPLDENKIDQVQTIDLNKIEDAKNNLQDAYENYQNDRSQIINEQPEENTNNLTTKLSTMGSVAALGAIGAGLYFAAPLLLGGKRKLSRKHKHQRDYKKKKTRSNKK